MQGLAEEHLHKIDNDAKKMVTYVLLTLEAGQGMLADAGNSLYMQARVIVTSMKVPFVVDKCSMCMGTGKACGTTVVHGLCRKGHKSDEVGSHRVLSGFVTMMDADVKHGRVYSAYILPHALAQMFKATVKEIQDFSYGMQMVIAKEFSQSIFIAQMSMKPGFISIVNFTQ